MGRRCHHFYDYHIRVTFSYMVLFMREQFSCYSGCVCFLRLEKAVKKKNYNLFILAFMKIDREIKKSL